MRIFIGIILCSIAPAWVVLLILKVRLLDAGILNKKDMPPFVGNETGTVGEYFLNVWHWDAMFLLLMVAALPCLIFGIILLRSERASRDHEAVA